MSLAKRVQHTAFGIGAHTARANLVNQRAGSCDKRLSLDDFSSGRMKQLVGALKEISIKLAVVVAVRTVDFQDGNAPLISDIGVELDEMAELIGIDDEKP